MASFAALACVATAAYGQENFPSHPITFLIGTAPGGAMDIVARTMAPLMSERLGQPVVVTNQNGAAGVVALAATARVKPDGYFIHMTGSGFLIAALETKDLAFDPSRDFTPIAMLAKLYSAWITTPGSGFANLSQVIAEAKAKPGTVSFAVLGGGGVIMLSRIQNATGARFNQIPYTGSAPAITAMLGGFVDLTLDSVGTTANNVRAGKLKPLAVTSLGPHDALPGVPPLSSVVPGVELASWLGMVGPAGMPAELVARLNQTRNSTGS
jgi:tripartite-type tricarboxylate transporter receptor subunit TctC